jgi:hypothetical protein
LISTIERRIDMKGIDRIQVALIAALTLITLVAFVVSKSSENRKRDSPEEIIESAIKRYGSGSIDGVEVIIAPAWELECGGSCIHYARKRIEVARGERWRQDLMHEVTHWLLYKDGHPPGTHHPIMYGRGLCYGGCDDVPQISH